MALLKNPAPVACLGELLDASWTSAEIAAELGVAPNTVSDDIGRR